MTLTLHHHPFSRAAGVVWMLEELGLPYELQYVDLMAGAQRQEPFKKLNPMGKLPTLVDDGVVVTEAAAIAVYLGDKHSLGNLAPKLDAPERATYLRWIFYSPSVIEPGCMAKAANWEYKPSSVGWGTYEAILDTISTAIGDGPWLLGETFTMADIVLGGTVRWMTMFGMLEKRPEYMAYVERLNARPASVEAQKINDRIVEERGLKPG